MTTPDAGLRERMKVLLEEIVGMAACLDTSTAAEVDQAELNTKCEELLALLAAPGGRFPVLYGASRPANGPESIPWEWVEKYGAQAERNHGQTLKRLAERGGLDPLELWWIVHGRRYGDTGIGYEQAVAWLRSAPWAAGALTEEGRAALNALVDAVEYAKGRLKVCHLELLHGPAAHQSDVEYAIRKIDSALALVARLSGGRA